MFLLGLTGSIGMGKSTTAQMFADEGCAVWDADAAVHRLYANEGGAVPIFRNAFPTSVIDGSVSRSALKEIIAQDPSALKKIEEIVHPLVGKDRANFIAETKADIVVLDIPLLFETGGEHKVDATACVFVDAATQQDRVMARGTMSLADFEMIKSKQLPAAEKCSRANYVITTDTIEHAREQVQAIVRDIRRKLDHA